MAASFSRIARRRGGVAGLEFALIAPVLVTLLAGTADVSNALLTARYMQTAAGAVAEIASTSSAQTQTLNKLTDVQAWQATTAPFAFFPAWTSLEARNTFAITISAIAFAASPSGCSQNCTYTASVQWSVANNLGQPLLRTCGSLPAAPDIDGASYATIPASVFGSTSILVADIAYTFRPYFFGFVIGNLAMMESAYISPRINNTTQLVPAGGIGTNLVCAVSS